MNEGDVLYRPLVGILCDAMRLAELAEELDPIIKNPPDDYDYFIFARASILNSAFLVECAINSCIDQTDQSKRQRKLLQKAPVMKKYEILLPMLQPGQQLNPELELVKMVRELIDVRNYYAHAKTASAKAEIIEESQNGGTFRMDPPQYPLTKIPTTLERCSHEDSINALRVATTFLSWYFCDLCKLEDIELNQSLKSVLALAAGYASLLETPHRLLLNRLKSHFNLRLDFLPEFKSEA